MRRFRGIAIFTLIMFLISNFSVFAEMPNNTVVIGDKAYDLNYVKRKGNYSEILKTMKKSPEIFVKSESGQWYENNTTSKILNDSIPKVTYKDANGKLIDYDINDGEKIGEPLSITENNKKISGAKINGNVYITGDNVTIHNSTVNGIIYIDPGKEGSTDVKNVTAKEIVILSGGENSIHLYNVTADKLEVSSDSKVRVESKGTTKVNNTIIKTYAIIDSVSGSFGEIRVSVENDGKKGEQQNVELRGTFTEAVIVETGVTLKAAKDASVKQIQIAPKNKNDNIKLLGDFKKIEVNKEANIELVEGQVDKIITNVKTKLNISKESKVKKLDKKGNKVETSGEGKKNITKTDKDNSKSSSSNNSGNSSNGGDRDNDWNHRPTPVVKVSSVIIDKNSNEIIINQGDSKQFIARVRYTDNSTNNAVVWESSDTSIATVVNGLVTVASDKIGSAVIKASATRGGVTKSDQVVVTIKLNEKSGIIKTNNGVVADNTSEYILRVNGDQKGSQQSPIEFYSDEYIVIEKDLIIEAGEDEFVKVRNIGVKGNIIIRGKDGKDGSVTFSNVKAISVEDENDILGEDSGNIIVESVAENSLHLEDGVEAGKLVVKDSTARIDVKDAVLEEVEIQKSEEVNTTENITLELSNKAVIKDLLLETKSVEIKDNTSNEKELTEVIEFVQGDGVDLREVKIDSENQQDLYAVGKEVNTEEKFKEKLEYINNLYRSSNGHTETTLYNYVGNKLRIMLENIAQMELSYEDGDGKNTVFVLPQEYIDFPIENKISVAAHINSRIRDNYNGKLNELSELVKLFFKEFKFEKREIEVQKFYGRSERYEINISEINVGDEVEKVFMLKEGETEISDYYKITPTGFDGDSIQFFNNKFYLMKNFVDTDKKEEDCGTDIYLECAENIPEKLYCGSSSTNLDFKLTGFEKINKYISFVDMAKADDKYKIVVKAKGFNRKNIEQELNFAFGGNSLNVTKEADVDISEDFIAYIFSVDDSMAINEEKHDLKISFQDNGNHEYVKRFDVSQQRELEDMYKFVISKGVVNGSFKIKDLIKAVDYSENNKKFILKVELESYYDKSKWTKEEDINPRFSVNVMNLGEKGDEPSIPIIDPSKQKFIFENNRTIIQFSLTLKREPKENEEWFIWIAENSGVINVKEMFMGIDFSESDSSVEESNAKEITGTTVGILDKTTINDVPADTIVSELVGALEVSEKANPEVGILTGDRFTVAEDAVKVTAGMIIRVTAEDGTTADYAITIKHIKIQSIKRVVIDKNKPLPDKVTVTLEDGNTEEKSVSWGRFDLEETGTRTVEVTIEGKVYSIEIEVIDNNAEEPVITSDLSNITTTTGSAITLNITAKVSDGGTVSYEWYSADDENKNNQLLITGQTNATYASSVKVAGTFYYYCVVTNTNNAATGSKTAKTTSKVSTVIVEAQEERQQK